MKTHELGEDIPVDDAESVSRPEEVIGALKTIVDIPFLLDLDSAVSQLAEILEGYQLESAIVILVVIVDEFFGFSADAEVNLALAGREVLQSSERRRADVGDVRADVKLIADQPAHVEAPSWQRWFGLVDDIAVDALLVESDLERLPHHPHSVVLLGPLAPGRVVRARYDLRYVRVLETTRQSVVRARATFQIVNHFVAHQQSLVRVQGRYHLHVAVECVLRAILPVVVQHCCSSRF